MDEIFEAVINISLKLECESDESDDKIEEAFRHIENTPHLETMKVIDSYRW